MPILSASIVVVTLNRDHALCETIEFFLPILDARRDIELVVVDQSRSHCSDTQSFLQTVASKIRLFTVSFVGMTKARNFGVAHARGEVVIFADDDVEPLEGFVEAHLKEYEDPRISGIAGCALAPGKQWIKRSELSPTTLKRLATPQGTRFDVDFSYDVAWATGCNMSFRREAIMGTGGFDEAFYGVAIGEDAEFCHRLRVAGGRMRYAPGAALIHHAHPSGGSRNEQQEKARIIALADNAGYYHLRIGAAPLQIARDLWWVYKGLAFRRKAIPYRNILKRSLWFLRGLFVAANRCRQPQRLRWAKNNDWDVSNWEPGQ